MALYDYEYFAHTHDFVISLHYISMTSFSFDHDHIGMTFDHDHMIKDHIRLS